MMRTKAHQYRFNVHYWNRYGNLTMKRVSVNATTLDTATKAIERRFKSVYDVECMFTTNPEGLPWDND